MKNIVISGHFFAITAALKYIVEACKRNKELNVITVGSYHGINMPYPNVRIVKKEYDFRPDYAFPPMPIGNSYIPIEMVENRLGIKPDIWLNVDAGFRFSGKPKNGININFLTDPHTSLRKIYTENKSNYDYIFNPQTPYMENDEIYLPYAADCIYNAPLEGIEKIYDVCIIGNYYQHRVDLINKLRKMGYKCFFELGYTGKDSQLIMNQSKICINWSSLDDLTARVFETLATGIILLTNRVTDINKHFIENEDYFGFSTENEAIEKVKYIIDKYEKLKKIGENGRNKIIQNHHFWDDRINTILEYCK